MTDGDSVLQVAARSRYKLHKRHTSVVFAFYMALVMAFLMCCVIVLANGGATPGYWWRVLKAYVIAMPAAFACVLLVRPLVMRLVAATVHH